MTGSRVYLGSLPHEITSREIEESFSRYGKLMNVWVARNPPGFAFLVRLQALKHSIEHRPCDLSPFLFSSSIIYMQERHVLWIILPYNN